MGVGLAGAGGTCCSQVGRSEDNTKLTAPAPSAAEGSTAQPRVPSTFSEKPRHSPEDVVRPVSDCRLQGAADAIRPVEADPNAWGRLSPEVPEQVQKPGQEKEAEKPCDGAQEPEAPISDSLPQGTADGMRPPAENGQPLPEERQPRSSLSSSSPDPSTKLERRVSFSNKDETIRLGETVAVPAKPGTAPSDAGRSRGVANARSSVAAPKARPSKTSCCPCPFKLGRARLSETAIDRIEALFARMDTDGDGAITREEASKFFQNGGFGKVSAEAMFSEVDDDSSATVTQDEFRHFWEQVRRSGYSDAVLVEELDLILEGGAWVDWKDQRQVVNAKRLSNKD